MSETLVIVMEKASMDVPGGGIRGLAARVKLTVALGSVQVTPEQGFGCRKPLHEPRPRAVINRANKKRDLGPRFIEHPSFGDMQYPMDDQPRVDRIIYVAAGDVWPLLTR